MGDGTLVTFAEYMRWPDPDGRLVLHHGRVVERPIHTLSECTLKNHVCRVLDEALKEQAFASMSIAYQPLPEYELWVAGVAVVSWDRFHASPKDGYIHDLQHRVMAVEEQATGGPGEARGRGAYIHRDAPSKTFEHQERATGVFGLTAGRCNALSQ